MDIVVAMTDNFVIGKNGGLPWHLPADLAHFKTLTTGHTVAMGRRTWESIGRPLPNRENVVITRQDSYVANGAAVVHSLQEVVDNVSSNCIFVIGGGEIYAQAIDLVDTLHITRIHTSLDGDTFFPKFDTSNWTCIESTNQAEDENNCHELTFERWIRTK